MKRLETIRGNRNIFTNDLSRVLNLADCCDIAIDIWDEIGPELIIKCWQTTGILETPQFDQELIKRKLKSDLDLLIAHLTHINLLGSASNIESLEFFINNQTELKSTMVQDVIFNKYFNTNQDLVPSFSLFIARLRFGLTDSRFGGHDCRFEMTLVLQG